MMFMILLGNSRRTIVEKKTRDSELGLVCIGTQPKNGRR